MRTTTAERLREILSRRNLRQVDILEMARPYCAKYGIKLSKSDLSQYVTGKVLPGQEKLTVLGLALNVSEAWLMGYDVPMKRDVVPSQAESAVPPGFEPLPKMVKRPLVGAIACGDPITAEENIEDYVDVPEDAHCDFCLRCKGDSMIDAGIHDGDIVYIHIQPEVENGQIAAVRIDGEATLKRVFWDKQQQILQLNPCNSSMSPMIFTGPVLDTVHIEGKAVGYTHWF